jgi:hypothetical protein
MITGTFDREGQMQEGIMEYWNDGRMDGERDRIKKQE